MKRAKLSDLQLDSKNANKGTQRGLRLLDDSLRELGAGRSIVLDAQNRIIAGNKTTERAADIGLEDVLIVETDGSQLVAVKRTDLDLENGDGRARQLAYYDNRVGELDLDWDTEQLAADLDDGLDLSGLWSELELGELGIEQEPPQDPGAQVDRAEELQQKWQVQRGQVWQIGRHRLMCGDSTALDWGVVDLVLTDPPYGINIVQGVRAADDWNG